MKRATESHRAGRIGALKVGIKFEELGWIFRDQSNNDYGIDAFIEAVSNEVPTGRTIAAQIKSGASYFHEEVDEGIVFRGKASHLDYWLEHDLPVVVILFDAATNTAFWQRVANTTAIRTPHGWKMFIPRTQKIEKSQLDYLDKIASEIRQLKEDIQEFKCPFCGTPIDERGGIWVGEEHYGLFERFQCGYECIDGCVQRPCPL